MDIKECNFIVRRGGVTYKCVGKDLKNKLVYGDVLVLKQDGVMSKWVVTSPVPPVGPITDSTPVTIEVASSQGLGDFKAGDELVMTNLKGEVTTYIMQTSEIQSVVENNYVTNSTESEGSTESGKGVEKAFDGILSAPNVLYPNSGWVTITFDPAIDVPDGTQAYLWVSNGHSSSPTTTTHRVNGNDFTFNVTPDPSLNQPCTKVEVTSAIVGNKITSISCNKVSGQAGGAIGGIQIGESLLGASNYTLTFTGDVSTNPDLKFFRPGDMVQGSTLPTQIQQKVLPGTEANSLANWTDLNLVDQGIYEFGSFNTSAPGPSGKELLYDIGISSRVSWKFYAASPVGTYNIWGSNDGTNWTQYITAQSMPGVDDAPGLINTDNYRYYRMNYSETGLTASAYSAFATGEPEVKVISTDLVNNTMTVDGGNWGSYNDGQVWSNGTVTGAEPVGPWTNFFDGDLSTRVFAANITNAFTQLDLANPINIDGKKVEIYGKKASSNTAVFSINNIDISSAVSTTNEWQDVTSLLTGQTSITTLKSQNGGDATTDFFALRVGGRIFIDAVEDSQVWSDSNNFSGATLTTPEGMFDGNVRDTYAYNSADNEQVTITFSPPLSASQVEIMTYMSGGSVTLTSDDGSTSTTSKPPGGDYWSAPLTVSSGTLTSLTWYGDGPVGQGGTYTGMKVDGILLVDEGIRKLGDTKVTYGPVTGTAKFVSTNLVDNIDVEDSNDRWIDNTNRLGTNFYVSQS